MNDLDRVKHTWEKLAQTDPLWAVLSNAEKKGKKWDVQEFLETGEIEIAQLLVELRQHGFHDFSTALDFGCGVGRLSIPLSSRFDQVTSIDISASMIETARDLAGDRNNINFILNSEPDISVLPNARFDLVYSNIVLQHMPPAAALKYIEEFYRVVKPGGFVVFQIPSHLTEQWLPDGARGTQLPAGAHLARLSVVDSPTHIFAGEIAEVCVAVCNCSDLPWKQDLLHQINLGNHWLSDSGEELVHDDGRARMPGRLDPGEECLVKIAVRAPENAGELRLAFDLVQEGICWFAERGSPTQDAFVKIAVLPAVRPATEIALSTEDSLPEFEMNGIPRHEIESTVAACGASVLEVFDFTTEWVSYRYITQRLN